MSAFGDAAFDLVVGLGVFYCASSRVEWDRHWANAYEFQPREALS